MRAPRAGRCAKREENATTAPARPGVFTASSATVPPCEKPMSTVRLAGTPKLVCSRRTRSSTSGSTAATRSRWLSQFRPRVGYQSWAAPPRAFGSKPLGTTSAALGKRAWNLNAIGIIDWDGDEIGATLTGRYVSKLREVGGNVMDSVFYTDAQLRFLVGEDDEAGFALGVNNLFDVKTPGCVTCESNNFSQVIHDIPGRYFYVRANFKM